MPEFNLRRGTRYPAMSDHTIEPFRTSLVMIMDKMIMLFPLQGSGVEPCVSAVGETWIKRLPSVVPAGYRHFPVRER